MTALARIVYRVRQFGHALGSYFSGLSRAQLAQIEPVLPRPAIMLYLRMPRPDQRHGFNVMQALRSAGYEQPDLLQAALLHDMAKHLGGVNLFHRVAAVLIKAFWPQLWQRWAREPEPGRSAFRYPFWAHAHHPEMGSRLAAEAGCGPVAVALIAKHQDGEPSDDVERVLLAALRAADEDN